MDPVQLVAFAGVFGLGMCFATLGSISVKLMPRLKIDQGKFGTIVSMFMFSCLVASLVVGVLVDSIGFDKLAIIGFLLTAVCLFLLATARSYAATVAACLLLGFGAMALNTVGNVLGPQVLFGGKDPARASNLLNVFFGLGLFLTPFLVSLLFRKVPYRFAVGALGVIVAAPVVFALQADFPKADAAFTLGSAMSLLTEPACIVAALVLFCYISLDASFCNWLVPFGKEVLSAGKQLGEEEEKKVDSSAQQMLSVYAVAMMLGRFLTSRIEGITGFGGWVIAAAALGMGLVILGMMLSKSRPAAWTLAALAGLLSGPCFPTAVGVTFHKFNPQVYGSLFGIIFAVGLAGAVIVPKAIGNLAKGSSVQKSLKLLLPPCALLIGLAILLGNVAGPAKESPATQPAATQPATTQPAATQPALPTPPATRPAPTSPTPAPATP